MLLVYPMGECATGWIARLLRRMAALLFLRIDWLFGVVAPCPAPPQPHTPPRPTALFRLNEIMHLHLLRVRNLRNLQNIEIYPSPGINLIYGNNGSGKTSLLESIYIIGRARSFRDTKIRSVIRDGENSLDVFSKVKQDQKKIIHIGVRKQGIKTEVRINQENLKKLSTLARLIPIQLLTPKSHEILERGPQHRRRFIEWGVFHVEHGYQEAYKRFSRALNQRNAALKQNGGDAETWNSEYIISSEKLNSFREIYVKQLEIIFNQELSKLYNTKKIKLLWKRGWKEGQTLEQTLKETFVKDIQLGFTQAGPQRADLQITIDDQQLVKRASRGEQKLIISALHFAQARMTKQFAEICPIFLIDDLPSEIDQNNRSKFLERFLSLDMQIFVTAIDKKSLSSIGDLCLFHVEHGRVKESK